jgi:hypothetical protein
MTQPASTSPNACMSRRRFLAAGRAALLGTALASMATVACAPAVRLVAQRPELMTPGALRIVLLAVDDNLITVDVFNQTSAPMVLYRDAVMLSTPTGMRARMRGGVGHVYTLPPGGVHKLRVRYDLYGLHRGDQVAMVFQNAIVINGQPVPVEPLPFVLQ